MAEEKQRKNIFTAIASLFTKSRPDEFSTRIGIEQALQATNNKNATTPAIEPTVIAKKGMGVGVYVDRTDGPVFHRYLDRENLRHARYSIYDRMDTDLVASALDVYANEATQKGNAPNVITVSSSSKYIQDELMDMLETTGLNNWKTWSVIRDMCKYGDRFESVRLDSKKGVTGLLQLDPRGVYRLDVDGELQGYVQDMEIVRQNSLDASSQYSTQSPFIDLTTLSLPYMTRKMKTSTETDKDNLIPFMKYEMLHFKRRGNGVFEPYGCSVLEAAVDVWKKVDLLLDSIIIYRLNRGPARLIFYVDVGNNQGADIENLVKRQINSINKRDYYDPTGKLNERYQLLDMNANIFIPVSKTAQNSKVDMLQPACLALDTVIPLLDGRELTLQDIITEYANGKENWVYSINPVTKEIVPGPISWAGITKQDAETITLTLDNGKEITCTPDHKFPIVGKGMIEAQHITISDSFLPFTTRLSVGSNRLHTLDGYQQIFDQSVQKWIYTHRMVARYFKTINKHTEYTYKLQEEKKTIIHHLDVNKRNNSPENLVFMGYKDHLQYHQDTNFWNIAPEDRKNEVRQKHRVISKQLWENKSLAEREQFEKLRAAGYDRYVNSLTPEEKLARIDLIKKALTGRSRSDESLKTWKDNISLGMTKYLKSLSAEEKEQRRLKNKQSNIDKFKACTDEEKQIITARMRVAAKSSLLKRLQNPEYSKDIYSKSSLACKQTMASEAYKQSRVGLIEDQKIKSNALLLKYMIDTFKKSNSLNETITKLNCDKSFLTLFSTLNPHIKNNDRMTYNRFVKIYKQHKINSLSEFENAVELYNHKIVKVTKAKNQTVGTITVDGKEKYHSYHTFALSVGVFTKNSNVGDIEDLNYLNNRLFSALKVPKAFLGFEGDVNSKGTLSQQNVTFGKSLQNIQEDFLETIKTLCIVHLAVKSITDEADLKSFTLNMTRPSYIEEKARIELETAAVALAQSYFSQGINKNWVLKHVLKKDDADIKEMLKLDPQAAQGAAGLGGMPPAGGLDLSGLGGAGMEPAPTETTEPPVLNPANIPPEQPAEGATPAQEPLVQHSLYSGDTLLEGEYVKTLMKVTVPTQVILEYRNNFLESLKQDKETLSD